LKEIQLQGLPNLAKFCLILYCMRYTKYGKK